MHVDLASMHVNRKLVTPIQRRLREARFNPSRQRSEEDTELEAEKAEEISDHVSATEQRTLCEVDLQLHTYFQRYTQGEHYLTNEDDFKQLLTNAVYAMRRGNWSASDQEAIDERAFGFPHHPMAFEDFLDFFYNLQPDWHHVPIPSPNLLPLRQPLQNEGTAEENKDVVVDVTEAFCAKERPEERHDITGVLIPVGTELKESNYHTWALVEATKSVSWPTAIYTLGSSLALVVTQIAICFFLVRQLDRPRCHSNKMCPSGMFCGGLGQGEAGGIGNCGSCYDCYYVLSDARWAKEMAPDDFDSGRIYCNRTDQYPTTCDFVEYGLDVVSGATILLIVCIAGLLSQVLIADQDEASSDWQLCVLRLEYLHSTKESTNAYQTFVFLTAYSTNLLRKGLLSPLLISACTALITTTPFTVNNIILNGLAISFIMEMDNVMYQYVSSSSHAYVDAVCEIVEQDLQNGKAAGLIVINEHLSIWIPFSHINFWISRLIAVPLSALLPVYSLETLRIQPTFRISWLMFQGDGHAEPASATHSLCGELSGLFLSTVLCSWAALGFFGLVRQRLQLSPCMTEAKYLTKAWLCSEVALPLFINVAGFFAMKGLVNYLFTSVSLRTGS